jgi:hypothetical protein
MKKIFSILLTITSATIVNAQGNLGENIKDQLIKDWEMAKVLTNEYLTLCQRINIVSNHWIA